MDEFEARLQRVEDEAAIQRLKSRYFNAGDTQDFETLASCFTADAHIDYPPFGVFCGGAALAETFAGVAKQLPAIHIHHGHNADISFSANDEASATWNLYYFGYFPATKAFHHTTAFYHDQYVRTADGWRISGSRTEPRLMIDGTVTDERLLKFRVPEDELKGA